MTSTMRERGHTLVELLVVMAVLGILSSIAMPLAEMSVRRERERELRRALWEIRDAIDAYQRAGESGAISAAVAGSHLPPTLEALTRSHADQRPGRRGVQLRFLRRVPRDPFADARLPAEQTWGLRSHNSEDERPEPGADVFDVHSRSAGVGINGVPLRRW
jgi:general secretion pathway protein G